MKKYLTKIDALISDCDTFVQALMEGTLTNEFAGAFCTAVTNLIPSIVELYSMPELSAHYEDIPAWIDQANRLLSTIQGKDMILLADVVSCELQPNLIELRSFIAEVH